MSPIFKETETSTEIKTNNHNTTKSQTNQQIINNQSISDAVMMPMEELLIIKNLKGFDRPAVMDAILKSSKRAQKLNWRWDKKQSTLYLK